MEDQQNKEYAYSVSWQQYMRSCTMRRSPREGKRRTLHMDEALRSYGGSRTSIRRLASEGSRGRNVHDDSMSCKTGYCQPFAEF
jgi:hypothetical protein